LGRVLLREDGGDRLMAKVLALVPSAGLDALRARIGKTSALSKIRERAL
jgi:hypothetical protein